MKWFRELAQKLLAITHGRTTAFFIAFFLAGHGMAIAGKLTPVYVGFMGTLGGLVLGHSIKEDYAEKLNGPRAPGGPDANPKS
jgi:hypothetical protein